MCINMTVYVYIYICFLLLQLQKKDLIRSSFLLKTARPWCVKPDLAWWSPLQDVCFPFFVLSLGDRLEGTSWRALLHTLATTTEVGMPWCWCDFRWSMFNIDEPNSSSPWVPRCSRLPPPLIHTHSGLRAKLGCLDLGLWTWRFRPRWWSGLEM